MPVPQYIEGETRPRKVAIATAKLVDKGDLVGMNAGTLVRAEDETWTTDLATTQSNFRARFAGVAAQSKLSTTNPRVFGNSQDNVIMVNTSGVFEFDCASATFEVGDFVGPAKDTGNALLSDRVVAVGAEANAIGRVAERGTAITRVKVETLSVLAPAARQS
ncbi:hypothetical protein VT84_30690 [Gemmata sp. SH-PL17]|uniref:hypothetical protein n=1 Tax=Gemmata sp. SH-PL17 TaxID=1630693 RepID=UPI00078E110F|nr:hypothetical protein [Gemmata sp. SH-PL17]AMV28801.1 hypothetical protein VT84_30690 [Gemmata sp. SH-PL17]